MALGLRERWVVVGLDLLRMARTSEGGRPHAPTPIDLPRTIHRLWTAQNEMWVLNATPVRVRLCEGPQRLHYAKILENLIATW